jgi:hypothetical protein
MPENVSDRLVHDGNAESLNANSTARSTQVEIRQYLDPVGYFEEIKGSNDKVPLMDKDISSDLMTLTMKGLGYRDSLSNILTNTLNDPSSVNRSFARALVYEKNREVLQPIINADYTGNTVSAASGGTVFENLYDTLFKAMIKVMGNTYTPSNGRLGDISGKILIIIPKLFETIANAKDRDIQKLTISAALGVDFVGVENTWTRSYGSKSAPNYKIPDNTAFVMYLPESMESHLRLAPLDVLSKTSESSALTGGSTEMASFRYSGVFNKYLLPNGAGIGCIVKANLPVITV